MLSQILLQNLEIGNKFQFTKKKNQVRLRNMLQVITWTSPHCKLGYTLQNSRVILVCYCVYIDTPTWQHSGWNQRVSFDDQFQCYPSYNVLVHRLLWFQTQWNHSIAIPSLVIPNNFSRFNGLSTWEEDYNKDSSSVASFSLQTNNTLSGGFISASGKSPILSSTTARECASFTRTTSSGSVSLIHWHPIIF